MILYGCILSEEEAMSLISDDKKAKFALENDYPMNLWEITKEFKFDNFYIDILPTAGKNVIVFGRTYESFDENETKKEYENSIKIKVKELFNIDINCFIMDLKDEN